MQTALVRVGDIAQTLTAYGAIGADPGAMAVYSMPADVRVVRLYVGIGQAVSKGTPLIDLEASADTKLQFSDARNALNAAKKNLADVKQRFDLKLATNSELLLAQQATQSAQAKVSNFESRDLGDGIRTLSANADSFVSKIDVQTGQVVPASGALMELLPKSCLWAKLGIEPGAVGQLRPNQEVQLLLSADASQRVPGKIRAVSQRVNPETRLVDVFVTPAADTPLLLDAYVRGELTLQKTQAMLVPRSAILPADQGFTLFTVKDGHAVKHSITIGIQNDREVAISGNDVHAGDMVVVQGNLELDDDTAVTTEAAK